MGDGRTDEHIEIRQANNFGIKIVSFVCYFIALGSFGGGGTTPVSCESGFWTIEK